MNFIQRCVDDSLPIWEQCLDTEFLRQLEAGTLSEACFKGYIVDDSLYLWEYARVFAWGILHSENLEAMRTFHSFLAFVNEGEGDTRVQYLRRYGLTDEIVEKLPQRPQNRAYTEYMLQAAREGVPECMMASLPCTLSYGWIFRRLVDRSPSVLDSVYGPLVHDYANEAYEAICEKWMAFGNKVCEGLSQQRLAHCMEIFRTCSLLELDFWKMSQEPRLDLDLRQSTLAEDRGTQRC